MKREEIRHELEPALINAAAGAYLLMQKEIPEDIVLWETLETYLINPLNIVFAEQGLLKFMQMKNAMSEKVHELEAVDQQG